MIAIDTSTWIAFLSGEPGLDVDAADDALLHGSAALPPVVLTELLSDPEASKTLSQLLPSVPLLAPHDGFWQRAGSLRASILRRGLRARLADALVAQSCIDHRAPLVTRDSDFRHYARWAGLKLVVDASR